MTFYEEDCYELDFSQNFEFPELGLNPQAREFRPTLDEYHPRFGRRYGSRYSWEHRFSDYYRPSSMQHGYLPHSHYRGHHLNSLHLMEHLDTFLDFEETLVYGGKRNPRAHHHVYNSSPKSSHVRSPASQYRNHHPCYPKHPTTFQPRQKQTRNKQFQPKKKGNQQNKGQRKYSYRSKQEKIEEVLKRLRLKYEQEGKLAEQHEVLRGEDTLRIDVKRYTALQQIEGVIERIENDNKTELLRVDFPVSQKNRFQKKGFIAYLQCGSPKQAQDLHNQLVKIKDPKFRDKCLFRVTVAVDRERKEPTEQNAVKESSCTKPMVLERKLSPDEVSTPTIEFPRSSTDHSMTSSYTSSVHSFEHDSRDSGSVESANSDKRASKTARSLHNSPKVFTSRGNVRTDSTWEKPEDLYQSFEGLSFHS